MTSESRVRFADGFDRPERIAFGLEAPQLAVVVAGSLLAWSMFHGSAPAILRGPIAAVIALLSAALGWGRWEDRPLLTWAWLAARFAALPRSGGGGGAAVLRAENDEAGTSDVRTGSPGGSQAATRAAGPSDKSPVGGSSAPLPHSSPAGNPGVAEPPPPPRRRPRQSPDATALAVREPAASTPAWLRWISPRPAVDEGALRDGETVISGGALGQLDFGDATHALISGWRRSAVGDPAAKHAAQARESVVLLPTPSRSGSISRSTSSRTLHGGDAHPALAPVLRLRTPEPPNARRFAPLELDDRAEPVGAEPRRYIASRTRRVAFFALSGGSGRTTLAVEAACLVAADGHRVAVLDLDLHAPAVAMRLGLPQPERWDPQLLGGGDRISCLDDLLVTHQSGARILLGPARAAAGDTLAPARVAELLHLLERDGAELVVLDLPGDLGALSTIALAAMDEVFIVVTPTARGVQDAYRTTEALRRIGLGVRLRYVVNRSRVQANRPRDEGDRPRSQVDRSRIEGDPTVDADLAVDVDLAEVMGDLGGEVVATVPFDAGLEAGEDTHRLTGVGGQGPTASALRRLGDRLLGPPVVSGRKPDPAWG